MSLRRAALHLHGLGEPDRRWVLEHLEEEERDHLTPLLSELTELGIPPLADGLIANGPIAVDAASLATIERIDRARQKEIEQLLATVPDHIVAAIVRYHPWRWARRIQKRRPAVRTLLQGAAKKVRASRPGPSISCCGLWAQS